MRVLFYLYCEHCEVARICTEVRVCFGNCDLCFFLPRRLCAGGTSKILTKLCYDLPCSPHKNRVSLYIRLLFALVSVRPFRCRCVCGNLCPLVVTVCCRLCITSCVWNFCLHEGVSTYRQLTTRLFLASLVYCIHWQTCCWRSFLSASECLAVYLRLTWPATILVVLCLSRDSSWFLLIASTGTHSSLFGSVPLPDYGLAFVALSCCLSSVLLPGDRYPWQKGYNSCHMEPALSKLDAVLQTTRCFLVKPLCSRWGKEREREIEELHSCIQ